jgi:hypothetical protein
MADQTSSTQIPLQRKSWSEKIAKNKEWFRLNVDYHIRASMFNTNSTPSSKDEQSQLYNIYNNRFPLKFFSHITDPLNAVDVKHKQYPAKIRPTSMIRTNIDLLLGEYPTRPFAYQVMNLGEDAHNTFLENLNGALEANLGEHFLAEVQMQMEKMGIPVEEMPQANEIELPESVQERFTASYKDKLAIRGQKWMKRAEREYNVRQKMLKMFKDWCIAGEVVSYKNMENGNVVYERVPVIEMDFGPTSSDFFEDCEWQVRRRYMSVAEVVDRFYDQLKAEQHTELEARSWWHTPEAAYAHINGMMNQDGPYRGKVPVYHVVWKGRTKVNIVEYTDPLTGEMEEIRLDEDTPIDNDMKLLRSEWVNEVHEGWRVAETMYFDLRLLPVQRNAMNNFSSCKMPYNGRYFSNTHSENISLVQMGLPYAIMYIITNYILEKTIAKSKGKIFLIDQNAIPNKDGWNEEKAFYYADALGYMLINRNQIGVDKSFNQYTTLDMSLFDHIEKLIMLRDSFMNDWDKLLGISPQRKAQVSSGDGLGTSQIAIANSNIITAMIFINFEEFVERDLQGLLDYSRFANTTGIRALYNLDDLDRELLMTDPNSYASAELGLFLKFSVEELQILREYKMQVQAMIQNGVKQTTILEIQRSSNLAELMAKLKQIEEIEMEQMQAAEMGEQERQKELLRIQNEMKEFESLLRINEINAEWDRKDSNTMIKGEFDIYSGANFQGDGDADNNGVPDSTEITKRVIAAQQIATAERTAQQKLQMEQLKLQFDNINKEKDRKLQREAIESKERTEKLKARTALKNKTSGEK